MSSSMMTLKRQLVETGSCPDIPLHDVVEYDLSLVEVPIISQYLEHFNPLVHSAEVLSRGYFSTLEDWFRIVDEYHGMAKVVDIDEVTPQQADVFFKVNRSWDVKVKSHMDWTPFSWLYWYAKVFQEDPQDCDSIVQDENDCQEASFDIDGCDCSVHKEVTHPIFKRGDNSSHQPFVPCLSLDESMPRVPYNVEDQFPAKHNGQLKLLITYCHFLSEIPSAVSSLLFYGSAPGHAIITLSRLLGITLHCVDDYPTRREDGMHYYSFAEYSTMHSSLSVDAIFVDTYTHDSSKRLLYDSACRVVENHPNSYYSIKRFVSYTSSNKRIRGSRFVPLAFSSSSSSEVREHGYYESVLEFQHVKGLENSLRNFNHNVRYGVRHGNELIACPCYDCSISDYILTAIVLKYSTSLHSLLRVFRHVQSGLFSAGDKDLYKHLVQASPVDVKGDLAYSSLFVWNYEFLKDSPEKVIYTKTSHKLPVKDSEGNTYPYIYRYHRPPRVAVFVGEDDSVKYQFALPLVNVTTKGFENEYFTPAKSGHVKSYTWNDAEIPPACVNCGYSEHNQYILLRDYLACFSPQSYSCTACDLNVRILYAGIT